MMNQMLSRTAATEQPVLEVRNLVVSFTTPGGKVRAVDDVSFSLRAGETLGIAGESGSGKSALARTIMRLSARNAVIEQGQIRLGGRDIHALGPAQMRRIWGSEIAMIFQDPMTSLNPVRRIDVQIADALKNRAGLSRKEVEERACALLQEVRIPDPARRLRQYPHELSGGMRQRVMIAIALAGEPKLMVADEPTTALDVTVQLKILNLLDRLRADRGMAMILITHDLGVLADHADRVAVMYAGQLVEQTSATRLMRAPAHPYTRALLDARPDPAQPSHSRLRAIPGRPPSLLALPPGCRFAARCAHRREDCSAEARIAITGSEDHLWRCLHPLGGEGHSSTGER